MKKILLVDDEPLLVELIAGQLDERGFDVVTMYDPLSALKEMESKKYSIIITDLKMPGIPGDQLVSYIRSNHLNRFSDIYVITGNIEKSAIKELKKQGVTEVVQKPVDFEDLVNLIIRHSGLDIAFKDSYSESFTKLCLDKFNEIFPTLFKGDVQLNIVDQLSINHEVFQNQFLIPIFGDFFGSMRAYMSEAAVMEFHQQLSKESNQPIDPTSVLGELFHQSFRRFSEVLYGYKVKMTCGKTQFFISPKKTIEPLVNSPELCMELHWKRHGANNTIYFCLNLAEIEVGEEELSEGSEFIFDDQAKKVKSA